MYINLYLSVSLMIIVYKYDRLFLQKKKKGGDDEVIPHHPPLIGMVHQNVP